MTSHWDEFSKSMAEESLPRRESLRRLGFLFAGAVLSPLGVGTAWAGGPDRCKTFCRCRNKSQQNACLAACHACNNDTSRLAGSCGSYTCCSEFQMNCGRYCAQLGTDRDCNYCGHDCASTGRTCCLSSCVNLADDFNNCGACRNACDAPGPFENAACIDGRCEYWCVEGAVVCDGACSLLDRDANNCGACGNFCGPDMICDNGVCTECAPELTFCRVPNTGYAYCADLLWDVHNCGACGNSCPGDIYAYCYEGVCTFYYPGCGYCE